MADTPGTETSAAPQPVADAPSGDYDFTDPGSNVFDSVNAAAVKEAAVSAAPAASPASPSAPAGTAQPAGETPPPAATPAASPTDTTPAAGSAAPPAAPAAQPSSNNQAAAAVAPAQAQLTQDLINRAAQVGMPAEALQSFSDPEKAILYAERAALQGMLVARSQMQQTPAQQPQQGGQQPQPQTAAAQQSPQAPPPFDENAVRNAWLQAGYDESVANMNVEIARNSHNLAVQNHQLMQWAGQANQEIAHMRQFLGEQAQAAQAQQVAHQNELVQRDFAAFKGSLDPALAKVIDQATETQIIRNAEIMARGLLNAGVPPQAMPDTRTLFQQATAAAIGLERMASIARDQVRSEVRNHQDLGIARPTSGGKPQSVPGDDAAASFADAWYAKHGLMPTGGGRSPLDV